MTYGGGAYGELTYGGAAGSAGLEVLAPPVVMPLVVVPGTVTHTGPQNIVPPPVVMPFVVVPGTVTHTGPQNLVAPSVVIPLVVVVASVSNTIIRPPPVVMPFVVVPGGVSTPLTLFAPPVAMPLVVVPAQDVLHTYTQVYQQAFRVADTAFDLFELFVGEGVAPDFTSPPAATSPTLPFSFTPTPPGTGSTTELHLVVRRRNTFDLQSFNVGEVLRTIDSASAEVVTISVPIDVQVYDGLATFLSPVAKYVSLDDPLPADTWEVFVTIGSDPDPLVDAPAFTGPMSFVGVESFLVASVGPFTPGTVAHVIVVAKRAAGSEVGIAAVVLKAVVLPLDLLDGEMFGGGTYEQR